MEGSTKQEKIQAMKKYKRAMFLYNLVLYSLTSLITCLFFSYSFWSPSMKFLLFSLLDNISIFFNAKCFFIVGNLIVFFLVRESKLTQPSRSSPASDIYESYLARTHESFHKLNSDVVVKKKKREDGFVQRKHIVVEGKKHESEIKFVEEKKMEMRVSKSMLFVDEKNHESEIKCVEEKKKEMRVSKSMHHRVQKIEGAMRKCKSEVWGESAISKKKDGKEEKEEQVYVPTEELNKRVEAFIARVNKQRLLEAK